MSLLPLDSCDIDASLRFKVTNLAEFFGVPPDAEKTQYPLKQSTQRFAGGWYLRISFHRLSEDDFMGIFLISGTKSSDESSYPLSLDLHIDTLGGRRIFSRSKALSSSSRGWRDVLARKWWERRKDSAVVVTASIKCSPSSGPTARSQPVLDFLHRTIKNETVSDIRFITFSHRSPKGTLSTPRVLLAGRAILELSSTYLRILVGSETEKHALMIRTSQSLESMKTFKSDYCDADSDLEEEDNDDNEEVPVIAPSETLGSVDVKPRLAILDGMQVDGDDSGILEEPEKAENNAAEHGEQDEDGSSLTASFDGITFVVDRAASATWEAVLFYLYTGIIEFAPLKSEGEEARRAYITHYNARDQSQPAPCSCKSMYRIALQMGLDSLQTLAINYLSTRLSATTILTEVFSEFTSFYDDVKKIEMAALRKSWSVLKGSAELKEKLSNIGKYPHAGWIIEECFQRMNDAN